MRPAQYLRIADSTTDSSPAESLATRPDAAPSSPPWEGADGSTSRAREVPDSSTSRPWEVPADEAPQAWDGSTTVAPGAREHVSVPTGADGLIVLKTTQGLRFEPLADLEWLEADYDHVLFHFRGERLRVRITMTELEGLLDSNRFLRISRSVLINLAHARSAVYTGSGQHAFEMRGGQRLVSSRSHGQAIRSLAGSVRRW